MAGNNQPIFVAVPTIDLVAVAATANTARDGTGTLASIATGTTNGKRLDRVVVSATGTTTAGMLRFFVYDGSSVYVMQLEVAVTALTPSATVKAFTYEWVRTDGLPLMVLPLNYVLKVGTHQAESFIASAHGGTF